MKKGQFICVKHKWHIDQLKKYGFKYVQEHLDEMEAEAYSVEETWFKNRKKVKWWSG